METTGEVGGPRAWGAVTAAAPAPVARRFDAEGGVRDTEEAVELELTLDAERPLVRAAGCAAVARGAVRAAGFLDGAGLADDANVGGAARAVPLAPAVEPPTSASDADSDSDSDSSALTADLRRTSGPTVTLPDRPTATGEGGTCCR